MAYQKSHVAVLAFPFGSHATPLLSLVRRVSAAAPNVRFSFFSSASSNSQIFPADISEADDNIKPYNVEDGLPEGYVFGKNPEEPVNLFLEVTPGNFRSAVEVAEKETGMKVKCLMSDAFLWFAAEMAEERRVPWIPLWTAGHRSLLVHLETDLLRHKLGSNANGEKTLELIPEFSTTRVADLPEGIVSGDTESSFARMLHKMGQNLPRATAVAISSYEELDASVANRLKLRFRNCLSLGFALATPGQKAGSDEHGCLSWLDQKQPASVVYISFGSVAMPPPHEVTALAEALEECGFPFLWSLRGDAKQLLPKGFTERIASKNAGKIVPWAPQFQVLKHPSVAVFVTHCGWNSVLESIIGGVPLIGRPYFGDHGLNMRTIEAVWRIGIEVENGIFTKTAVLKALNLIFSAEKGQRIREEIQVHKELAMKAMQSSGSATKNFKTLVELISR